MFPFSSTILLLLLDRKPGLALFEAGLGICGTCQTWAEYKPIFQNLVGPEYALAQPDLAHELP